MRRVDENKRAKKDKQPLTTGLFERLQKSEFPVSPEVSDLAPG
jgi:hypothetical protein